MSVWLLCWTTLPSIFRYVVVAENMALDTSLQTLWWWRMHVIPALWKRRQEDPCTTKLEAGRSEVQCHPQLPKELEVIPDYVETVPQHLFFPVLLPQILASHMMRNSVLIM